MADQRSQDVTSNRREELSKLLSSQLASKGASEEPSNKAGFILNLIPKR